LLAQVARVIAGQVWAWILALFHLLPVSAGFGVAERNEVQRPAAGRRSDAVAKRREVKRSRTGRTQAFLTEEAVCGFQQVSEKPVAKPGAENRSLPTIQ